MSKDYDPSVDRKWSVKYQEMPEKWFLHLPDSEYIMTQAKGWRAEADKDGSILMRHFEWHTKDPETFPEVLQNMMKCHECTGISLFMGTHEKCNNSLGWHVDDYNVWGFNITGVTKWTWWSIAHPEKGVLKEQIVEPGHIITMPRGVSHKVDVLSEERTSISIINQK